MNLLRIVPKQAYADTIIWIKRIIFLTSIYQEVSEPESLRRRDGSWNRRLCINRFHEGNFFFAIPIPVTFPFSEYLLKAVPISEKTSFDTHGTPPLPSQLRVNQFKKEMLCLISAIFISKLLHLRCIKNKKALKVPE